MTRKIFENIVFVAIFVLLATVLSASVILSKSVNQNTKEELVYETELIQNGVNIAGIEYIYSLPITDRRITLIDQNGKVLYDNKEDASLLENHSSRKEFIEASGKGFGTSERVSTTLLKDTVYYAVKLNDGNILRLSLTKDIITNLFYNIISPIIIICFFVVIIALYIANKISKKIVEPLWKINPENDDKVYYTELKPLINQIDMQKKTLSLQEDTIYSKDKQLECILNNLQEGLIIIDNNLNILSINNSALKLFNVQNKNDISNIFLLDRSPKFQNAIEIALLGKHAEIEINLGSQICSIISSPTYNAKKELIGVVLVIIDVTEKIKKENIRKEFTSNVSHELKTPLTSISGFAEIMKNGMVDEENMKKFSENIYKEAQRLIKLVTDILKLSQMDELQNIKKNETINIKNIISRVIFDLKWKASESNVSIINNSENIYIDSNEKTVYDIIYNLVENAIKYNVDGGEVKINTIEESDKIGFEVTDTGVGIEKEEQERIFERFYRVDKARSKAKEGNGLGLSIVKNSVQLSGGNLEIQSILGQGTTITVYWNK